MALSGLLTGINFDNASANTTTGNESQWEVTTTPSRAKVFIPWNNPENIISKELTDEIIFVLECVIFPIITVFGVSGNIMSLLVLLQQKMRSGTNICLAGLAVSDTMFLITNFLRKSSCILIKVNYLLAAEFATFSFSSVYYTKTAFSRVTTYLTVLISLERLFAVAVPLKVKVWFTSKRMILAVVIIYVVTFGALSPLAAQYTVGELFDRTKNATIYYIEKTDFYKNNPDFVLYYDEVFLMTLFRYIPGILVAIFNVVIIVLMKRRSTIRKNMTATQLDNKIKHQQRLTKMLLIISCVFLVCLIPGSVFIALYRYVDGFVFLGKYHNLFLVLSDISLLFEMTNSSINFIIYMLLNKNFTGTYRRLFCTYPRLARLCDQVKASCARKSTSETTKQTDSSVIQPETENNDEVSKEFAEIEVNVDVTNNAELNEVTTSRHEATPCPDVISSAADSTFPSDVICVSKDSHHPHDDKDKPHQGIEVVVEKCD